MDCNRRVIIDTYMLILRQYFRRQGRWIDIWIKKVSLIDTYNDRYLNKYIVN